MPQGKAATDIERTCGLTSVLVGFMKFSNTPLRDFPYLSLVFQAVYSVEPSSTLGSFRYFSTPEMTSVR